MIIDGSILIGAHELKRDSSFKAVNPATGEVILQSYSEAELQDVADACALAHGAVASFSTLSPQKRAAFIEAIADAVRDIGDVLIETAMAETGLPRARLEGERSRTINQLGMFAAEVLRGEWLGIAIDPALPDRSPPRSDLRRMNIALGPVAVFGASNFPLAFSVAGGDTASAFAAGCPVVVKGHPAHPGTGELVARAIRSAVMGCGLHEGTFSYLPGTSHDLGAALVADPRIKAVGFTGSRAGGLALVDIAAKRAQPIPVFAEMSSINPVVLMPCALAARAAALGSAFAGSLTLGAGQFCTNPGLVIALDGPGLDQFVASAAATLASLDPPVMLNAGIYQNYRKCVASLDANSALIRVGEGKQSDAPNRCVAALFETSAAAFLDDAGIGQEVFGASAIVVRCKSISEVIDVVDGLEGQLTASLHMDDADAEDAALILPHLQSKVGRVLANGWPTGVEVTNAMVHGGPYPATSDGRSTSVGTLAMTRFLRPVCFQDIPDSLLPPPLKAGNPWVVPQTVDGKRGAVN